MVWIILCLIVGLIAGVYFSGSGQSTQPTVVVAHPPVVERTVDRSAAGEALDELFGGGTTPAREIPRRPAPRGDTPILGGQ